ncbi:MAG: BMP family ABC transporter substrate-binding protein [Lachnospiraceae bacterium]|nr:BMP family ABC transporter substrate-binding protein [Lachnospiraceae bacterium]
MKKVLSVVLALVMVCSLSACGSAKTTAAKSGNDVPDSMTASDGKYQIALVTDVGQLKDGSFNEGTWNGVKLYASQNGKSYKYYQPANGSEATDDDRYNAMAAAADAGAEIIVAPGFLQATALEKAATNYPDVKFVFIDGWSLGLDNVAAVAYKEHECGYFAGYAVVKDGYTKLGFCGGGGGTNPACCRYGYGFVQGANDAAKELGVNVDINYTWLYGSSYSPSTELQTLANGWYETGTEVIFACGGTLCQSVFAAASANDAKVVGVDVDQANDSPVVITSAMKELANSVQQMCAKFYGNEWSSIGNTCQTLGAKEGDTGLPTAESSWRFKKFTVDEYNKLFNDVVSGKLVIDDNYEANFSQSYSNATVNVVE